MVGRVFELTRSGFVQAVKARGKYYFYVRIAYRDDMKRKRNKNILALGQKEVAISLLSSWIEDGNVVPDELKKYASGDFERWLKYVQDK